MQANNSVQAARKSHKLESLPSDLKSEAQALIDAKFPKPKESKKKSEPGFRGGSIPHDVQYGYDPSIDFPNTQRLKYYDAPDISAFNNFSPTDVVQINEPQNSRIDPYSLDRIKRYRGMNGDYIIKMRWQVSPIGDFTFRGDRYTMMHLLKNEEINLTIAGGDTTYIERRLVDRLHELENHYGGYFVLRLVEEQVEPSPWSQSYRGAMYGY